MATFKISQDKENQIQFHQKKGTMATQKQRSVLGILNGNKALEKDDKAVKKTAFGVRNQNTLVNIPNPQVPRTRNINVPVAQFQAFKVYEDSPQQTQGAESQIEQMEISDDIVVVTEDSEVATEDISMTAADTETVAQVEEVADNKQKLNISALLPQEKSMNESLCYSEYSFYSVDRSAELNSIEYQKDIMRHLREMEVVNRPKPGYMKKQPDISHSMRTILVDWLVEVAEEYKLHTETLYLAINFIDRFLSYMSVVRAKLQLVGTAALFIASKFEEVIPPEISEFVYITDDTYTQRQVIRMEQLILKVLQFDLATCSPYTFIKLITTIIPETTPRMVHLASYICELGLLEDEPFLEFLPSCLAASSIALAQHTLALDVWPQSFVELTGFKLHNLKRCIIFLDLMFKKAPNMAQKAIQEKYKSQKFYHVAKILPREDNIIIPDKDHSVN